MVQNGRCTAHVSRTRVQCVPNSCLNPYSAADNFKLATKNLCMQRLQTKWALPHSTHVTNSCTMCHELDSIYTALRHRCAICVRMYLHALTRKYTCTHTNVHVYIRVSACEFPSQCDSQTPCVAARDFCKHFTCSLTHRMIPVNNE